MNILTSFISHQNHYLMLMIGNLGVILFLLFFPKAAVKNRFYSFLWFIISVSLGMGSAIVIALTLKESKSSFLGGMEITFGCLLFIALILGSKFGSTVECVGTVVDNNLKIGYPVLLKEAKAIKVICEEDTLKTRFVTFEKRGADVDAILATDNPGMFRIGEKVKFKAVLREGASSVIWPAPGPLYFETRTWNGYIRPLAV